MGSACSSFAVDWQRDGWGRSAWGLRWKDCWAAGHGSPEEYRTRDTGQDDPAHLLYSLKFSRVEACANISSHRHEDANVHTQRTNLLLLMHMRCFRNDTPWGPNFLEKVDLSSIHKKKKQWKWHFKLGRYHVLIVRSVSSEDAKGGSASSLKKIGENNLYYKYKTMQSL